MTSSPATPPASRRRARRSRSRRCTRSPPTWDASRVPARQPWWSPKASSHVRSAAAGNCCPRSTRSFGRRTAPTSRGTRSIRERSAPTARPPATRNVASRQRETVRRLAEETDGRSIANSPDLAAGLRRIVDDASGYYVMTFRGAEDGRFHPLEVRVNRPGARVRARPGYWAVSAEEVARIRKASMPVAPPPPLPPPTHVSPLIRPWFGVARGDEGRSRVTMVWEPARARDRRSGSHAGAGQAEGHRLDAGRDVALFEGVVVPAGASAVGGESTQAVFDVAPGRVRLQDVGRRCGLAGARHRRQRGRRRWTDGCGRHRHARGPARAHRARLANAGRRRPMRRPRPPGSSVASSSW